MLPRLCDLLLEAVGWAGGLDSEIGDAGNQVLKRNIVLKSHQSPSFQVALALTIKKQEAIKIEMEESLQPKEIKMIVPPTTVKL